MKKPSSFPVLLFFVIVAAGFALAYAPYSLYGSVIGGLVVLCAAFVVASIASNSIKVATPWDRAVVLRLGKFRALRGPGVFGIIPIIDTIPITAAFKGKDEEAVQN